MSSENAIFIDGENLSCRHHAEIRAICGALGRGVLTRVYGDIALIAGWTKIAGIRPVHTGSGKNAADLCIAMDAIEFAALAPRGCVVLVSSDRDFTPLAFRLRERGLRVIGIGEKKTTGLLRSACSEFHELAVSPAQVTMARPAAAALTGPAAPRASAPAAAACVPPPRSAPLSRRQVPAPPAPAQPAPAQSAPRLLS